MSGASTVAVRAGDLRVYDCVDLLSCPYLYGHSSAQSEYAVVTSVTQETPTCVFVGYEGITPVGYDIGTCLQVRRREAEET